MLKILNFSLVLWVVCVTFDVNFVNASHDELKIDGASNFITLRAKRQGNSHGRGRGLGLQNNPGRGNQGRGQGNQGNQNGNRQNNNQNVQSSNTNTNQNGGNTQNQSTQNTNQQGSIRVQVVNQIPFPFGNGQNSGSNLGQLLPQQNPQSPQLPFGSNPNGNGGQTGPFGSSNSPSNQPFQQPSNGSNSGQNRNCTAPFEMSGLFVAPGTVAANEDRFQRPLASCDCNFGKKQFWRTTKSRIPSQISNDREFAYYLTQTTCRNLCILSENGIGYTNKDQKFGVGFVPHCLRGECHTYVAVDTINGGDLVDENGTPFFSPSPNKAPVAQDSGYLKAVSIGCTGCEILRSTAVLCQGPAKRLPVIPIIQPLEDDNGAFS